MPTESFRLDAENLSAAVPGEYPLTQLQDELKAHGLCYPPALDLESVETVGEHLTQGTCGPWRLGRGTARDWVLGLELLTEGGRLVRTGSGVIKNVAGLDLTKLVIGSQGRLGTVVSVNLRLSPLPQAVSLSAARFGSPGAALEALPGLLSTPLNPGAVELDDATLLVGLDGTPTDLERRARVAAELLHRAGGQLVQAKSLRPSPWETDGVVVRAGLPASRARPWVDALPQGTPVRGHAGSGIFSALLPADPDLLRRLRDTAVLNRGYMTVESSSAALPPDLFARNPGIERIEAAIRQAFRSDLSIGERRTV